MVVAIINRMPRRGLSCIDVGSFTKGRLIMHHADADELPILQIKVRFGFDYFATVTDLRLRPN